MMEARRFGWGASLGKASIKIVPAVTCHIGFLALYDTALFNKHEIIFRPRTTKDLLG